MHRESELPGSLFEAHAKRLDEDGVAISRSAAGKRGEEKRISRSEKDEKEKEKRSVAENNKLRNAYVTYKRLEWETSATQLIDTCSLDYFVAPDQFHPHGHA